MDPVHAHAGHSAVAVPCHRFMRQSRVAIPGEAEDGMGRLIKRLVVLWIGFMTVAAAAAAVGAQAAKRHLVPSGEPDSDEVTLVGIFEPVSFASTAQHFRGGTLVCWYGGGVIDLRGATLDPAGAELTIRAIFGGAQILVPDDWQVTTSVVGIFGGAGDARSRFTRPAGAPRLLIDGLAIFGGIGITSQSQAGEAGVAPAT